MSGRTLGWLPALAMAGWCVGAGVLGSCGSQEGAAGVLPEPGEGTWGLVFRDEFDGPAGTLPDPDIWSHDLGGHGWGNQQLEHNTDRAENAALDGLGHLVLTARRENYLGNEYTSARLHTRAGFTQAYGRFEARMQLPTGQGLWPAFWLLGADHGVTADWPDTGEIDVMEYLGHEPQVIHGTVHGPGYSGSDGLGGSYTLPAEERFDEGFHVFAIEWDEHRIAWLVDGEVYHVLSPDDLPSGARWVFDHPFFILLNLAVGGLFPGNPDETTTFPQRLLIDYVRAYRRH